MGIKMAAVFISSYSVRGSARLDHPLLSAKRKGELFKCLKFHKYFLWRTSLKTLGVVFSLLSSSTVLGITWRPPPMYLKTYDLKNLGKFHIKLIETSLEAGEKAA